MRIYGNMQMSRLNPANQQRGINPTLGIGQNRSRDNCSQPISDEYFTTTIWQDGRQIHE